MRAHAHEAQLVRSGVVGLVFKGNVPIQALVAKGRAAPPLKAAKAQLEEAGQRLLGGVLVRRAVSTAGPVDGRAAHPVFCRWRRACTGHTCRSCSRTAS